MILRIQLIFVTIYIYADNSRESMNLCIDENTIPLKSRKLVSYKFRYIYSIENLDDKL